MYVLIYNSYRSEFWRFDVVSGPYDCVGVHEGYYAVLYDAVAEPILVYKF